MTRTPTTNRSSRRARRWAVLAAVAATSCIVTVVDTADTAQAGRRTKSDAIATAADRALDALDQWNETQHPADYVRFVQSREQAAEMTAVDLDADPAAMRDAWASASAEKQRAVLAAMSQLGVPYGSLESEPGVAFDCSGLTIWAFGVAGIDIPRVSGDQIADADSIERAEAEPGDLVYYPGHVGIYLGEETYVHSPNSGSHVEAVQLPDKSLRFGDTFGDSSDDRVDAAGDAAGSVVAD